MAAGRDGRFVTAVPARLDEWLRAQSVSTDPAFETGMERARVLLAEWLAASGLGSVRRLEAGGHPALFAEARARAPDRPTVLVYGHYDVQPPGDPALWTTLPFEPSVRSGRLYARGASDDKGPVAIALEAIGRLGAGGLPVNLKLLVEGEEEVGSRTLPAILAAHRDLLAADVVVSADGARWRADLPTVIIGTRGGAGFGIVLRTASKELHSGRYGGIVRNACHELAALLASLHDRDGSIAVAGFEDDMIPPDPREVAAARAVPFDEAAFLAPTGAAAHGIAGAGTLERLWFRPTIEVIGMAAGYQGPGIKTSIPAEAMAKLSLRLVPGQDPVRAVETVVAHLRKACPPGVALEFVHEREGSPAYLVPQDHPVLEAIEETIEACHGTRPLRVRMGATLPLCGMFRDALGIETLPFSYSTADEDFHAPDEHIRLSAFEEGIPAWMALLTRIGRMSQAAARGVSGA